MDWSDRHLVEDADFEVEKAGEGYRRRPPVADAEGTGSTMEKSPLGEACAN